MVSLLLLLSSTVACGRVCVRSEAGPPLASMSTWAHRMEVCSPRLMWCGGGGMPVCHFLALLVLLKKCILPAYYPAYYRPCHYY